MKETRSLRAIAMGKRSCALQVILGAMALPPATLASAPRATGHTALYATMRRQGRALPHTGEKRTLQRS